MINRLHLILGS